MIISSLHRYIRTKSLDTEGKKRELENEYYKN